MKHHKPSLREYFSLTIAAIGVFFAIGANVFYNHIPPIFKNYSQLFITTISAGLAIVLYGCFYLKDWFLYFKTRRKAGKEEEDHRKDAQGPENEHQDYEVLSVEYDRADDSQTTKCDIRRIIAAKTDGLTTYKYRYTYTGKELSPPTIKSTTHEIEYKMISKDANGWNGFLITFKHPLKNGERIELMFHFEYQSCEPFLFYRLIDPTNYLAISVTLCHKKKAKPAKFIRRSIKEHDSGIDEFLTNVPYDKKRQRYFIEWNNLQANYKYQLQWT